jgi:hypothetical protein
MFGIKNPINPSTAFTATITTRDSSENLIDGPSQTNVYTIKKVGSSDLADGSVTSTKPAESFMKKVSVFDNAAGHAVGWDPNGASTVFTISEPAIVATDGIFFTVEVVNTICAVDTHFSGTFQVRCQEAPIDSSALRYVVGNLPEHIVQ